MRNLPSETDAVLPKITFEGSKITELLNSFRVRDILILQTAKQKFKTKRRIKNV